MNILIIGLGGIGSRVAEILHFQYNYSQNFIIGCDNDVVTEENLARQTLFDFESVNSSKVSALFNRGILQSAVELRFPGTNNSPITTHWPEIIFCCADNLAARQETLKYADMHQIPVIITGNETYAAEAYIYLPAWFSTARDPRRYYPELKTTDTTAHPCVEGGIQTIMANFAAATFAVYLFDLYREIKFNPEKVTTHAFHFKINKSEVSCKRNKNK